MKDQKFDVETLKALKALGIEVQEPQKPQTVADLTFGIDVRGDLAFFMEHDHVTGTGWDIDEAVKNKLPNNEPIFFRLIWKGVQDHNHGWIENGKIVQWG